MSAMTRESQWIGRRGETRFDVLCSDAGVTVNSSIWDDYGWDKLIEYPPRVRPFIAIDMQPEHVVAAVQVKTTTKAATRSVSISLSNALRYAKASIPQFVLLINLDGVEPRYFVRHVWGPLIADWLKAGRQADADGVTEIHLRNVKLHFADSDELSHGQVLPWIRGEIEAVQPVYAATKKLFVDTVGFENGNGIAQMTFSLDSAADVLDLELGLRPHLDVKRFVYTSERFGIRAGKPEIDQENVRIHLTPKGRLCALRLEFPRGGSLTIPATLYQSAANGIFAMRVVSQVLEVIYGPHGRVRAHAKLLRDDRVALDELSAFIQLLSGKADEGVSIHADIDDQLFDLGSITMTGPDSGRDWSWTGLGLEAMRAVARESGQSPAALSMADVRDAEGDLQIFGALAVNRPIRLDFTPAPNAPAMFGGFLAYSNATIGDQVYSAVAYRPIGKDTKRGRRRSVYFGAGQLLWGRIARSEGWSEDAVRAAYQRHLDLQAIQREILAVGDLARVVRKGAGRPDTQV